MSPKAGLAGPEIKALIQKSKPFCKSGFSMSPYVYSRYPHYLDTDLVHAIMEDSNPMALSSLKTCFKKDHGCTWYPNIRVFSYSFL